MREYAIRRRREDQGFTGLHSRQHGVCGITHGHHGLHARVQCSGLAQHLQRLTLLRIKRDPGVGLLRGLPQEDLSRFRLHVGLQF